jgi:hypothetical protein
MEVDSQAVSKVPIRNINLILKLIAKYISIIRTGITYIYRFIRVDL